MKAIHLTLLSLVALLSLACGAPQTDVESPRGAAVSADAAAGGEILSRGTFDGRNDHVVTGGVEIVERDGELFLILDDAFTLDGAPDPKIGFGKGGTYDTSTTFTPLGANTGAQTYALPAGFDPTGYDEAYIWCEQFSVALGVAALE